MRTKIVAGNWKMNKSFGEADDLIHEIADYIKSKTLENKAVIICPPAVYLELATDIAQDIELYVGGQNISNIESGAYTGEISAPMLESMGVDYCIIGHSERRKYFNESHDMIAQKVSIALNNNISPIFCCGELLPERNNNKHFEVVEKQLNESVFQLNGSDFSNITIAYEPVWAIGTGVNATSGQAQEMHSFIRELITKKFGAEIAVNTSILYGGSCNAGNAKELFLNPDVDGGLIGGASLKSEEFIKIIEAL